MDYNTFHTHRIRVIIYNLHDREATDCAQKSIPLRHIQTELPEWERKS
jgi:hypothetical protein